MFYIRSNKGSQCAELGAALTCFLPLLITCFCVAAETIQFFMINSGLQQVANTAARQLAIAYMTNPTTAMANPSSSFTGLTFLNIVTSTNQFSVPSGSSGWNTSNTPPTVTVVVTFKSGQNGCANFPNPDPLGIGTNFSLSASATALLE